MIQPSPSPVGVYPPQVAFAGGGEVVSSPLPWGGNLTMRGSIRARGTCDRCGGKWRDEYARGRQVAVVCSVCGVSAPAVYVDARGFRDRKGNVGQTL